MPVQGLPQAYCQHLGALLREARERQSLDRADIALKIALSPSQLRLLEEGQTEPFYNRSFYLQAAQRYSAFLGIALPAPDSDPSPTHSLETIAQEKNDALPPNPSLAKAPRARASWIITATAAVVAVGILAVLQSQPREDLARAETAPAPAPAATVAEPPVTTAEEKSPPTNPIDSRFVNSAGTWIQIVKKDGSKTNLRPAAGETIEFESNTTAAIAFGKPETASLQVRGSTVSIERFLVQEAQPPRALVILRDL
jgi:cytoskeletal protein RodZ